MEYLFPLGDWVVLFSNKCASIKGQTVIQTHIMTNINLKRINDQWKMVEIAFYWLLRLLVKGTGQIPHAHRTFAHNKFCAILMLLTSKRGNFSNSLESTQSSTQNLMPVYASGSFPNAPHKHDRLLHTQDCDRARKSQ